MAYLSLTVQAPPFYANRRLGGTIRFADPYYPLPSQDQFPTLLPGVSLSGPAIDRGIRTPYFHQYNFSVQWELAERLQFEEAAYAAQKELEHGRRLVVGVNTFQEEAQARPPLLTVDPAIETDQVARLAAFRAARNAQTARDALERLRLAASEERNLVPGILDAVSCRATLGEIVSALKTVYGEYRPEG